MKKVGCYGASLDPITNGHIAIIKESLKVVDKLIIGVGTNPDKKGKYMFSTEERVDMTKKALKEFGNKIKVFSFEDSFLVDFANKHNCNFLIRGLRNEKDFQDELILNNLNKELNPNINTIFLMSEKSHVEISSSLVKSFLFYKNFKKITKEKIPRISYYYLLRQKLIEMIEENTNLEYKTILNVLNRYIDEKRHYHTLEHLYNMLIQIDENELGINKEGTEIIYLATLYHDVIYDPKSTNGLNEKESSSLFEVQNFNLDSKKKKLVSEIILSTIKHKPLNSNKLCEIFLDLDLSILGSEDYEEYMLQIQKEYSFVPKVLYNKNRKKILKNFLKRDKIYFSEDFEHLESRARKNIKDEIKRL